MKTTLSDAGQRVFNARYAARDEKGNICETFDDAVVRLAKTAASVESDGKWFYEFKHMLENLLFVPSTPIWANVGKDDRPWQPSACFVLDIEDSLESMYEVLKQAALIFKSGGGVGYNFSKIRPKGSLINSTKGKASGVVELIKIYNCSSDMVMQGGVRRGASMGILNIDHPEIMNFITAKLDGSLTNFNLSVGITNDFMSALEKNGKWNLSFNGKVHDTIDAWLLWDLIVSSAHACGDPGIVFLDNLQASNPMLNKKLTATNPCGEQPLLPGESCLLGSINLAKMLGEHGSILDIKLFDETVYNAVRFLDNMIDVANYPLPEIDTATRATRKIGLGFTGLADILISLKLPYDSTEGRNCADYITNRLYTIATKASQLIGNEKGCFPTWEESAFYPGIPMRNATRVTIAPTGSVTTLAGCEGYGVEPIFAVSYDKATNVAGNFTVFSPLFVDACIEYGVTEDILAEVAKTGSCQNIPGVPVEIQKVFKGAQDINPRDHLMMQAIVQGSIDNAVSKTINLPNTATVADIDTCFKFAHNLKLKGVTIFRDGCKEGTVMVGGKTNTAIKPRPQSAHGETVKLNTGCGKLYLTVNYESGNILEVFITTGSNGGCLIYSEATSRLISLAIRSGVPVELIIEQLKSTHSCPSYMFAKGQGKDLAKGSSCASVIANKLQEMLATIKGKEEGNTNNNSTYKCIECGASLQMAEGCLVCPNCGYSKC